MQLQGAKEDQVDAIALGKLDDAKLEKKDRELLAYVEILTLRPSEVTDANIQRLRKAGWTDEEIFEASYIVSLFSFFNRMADAYGLDYVPQGWNPPKKKDK